MKPKHRWEGSYPHDGLVFTIYTRDLPLKGNYKSDRRPTWNRDSAWFSKDESEKLIPNDLKAGQSFEFPEFFTSRLAKLHFVDAVKGQTESFNENEIESSSFRGKVVNQNSNQLTIEVSGSIKSVSQRRWKNGVETKLKGFVEYDSEEKKFAKFEFVATGERWGRTRFNGRRRETDRSPIGYAFEMAKPDAPILVPGIVWAYDADWISQPSE